MKRYYKIARYVFTEHAWSRTWPLNNPGKLLGFKLPARRVVSQSLGKGAGRDKGCSHPWTPLLIASIPLEKVLLKMRGQGCPRSHVSVSGRGQVTHPRK